MDQLEHLMPGIINKRVIKTNKSNKCLQKVDEGSLTRIFRRRIEQLECGNQPSRYHNQNNRNKERGANTHVRMINPDEVLM